MKLFIGSSKPRRIRSRTRQRTNVQSCSQSIRSKVRVNLSSLLEVKNKTNNCDENISNY